MRIAKLRIKGFRGIRTGEFLLNPHSTFIGPNGSGKSTIIDALSLIFGRTKMVRTLTEHDFIGSNPQAADRIQFVATLTGFSTNNVDDHTSWFRQGRAVPKWLTEDGELYATYATGRSLAAQIAFSARFDREELNVESRRYFCDDDTARDPFTDNAPQEQVPIQLLNDVGFFVLPARRSWEGITSFNSDLFRKTVSSTAGIPATEILTQRDHLRAPQHPLENSTALADLVVRINGQLSRLMIQAPHLKLRVTNGDSESVLQALVPHFETTTASLPASRHGMGLLSLQSMLLLLEVGRARKSRGLSFILGIEEPELHLAPGVQHRLVAEAIGLADQTICTTHSPRVATIYPPTATYVMGTANGDTHAAPLLQRPLTTTAANNERKLFIQNRVRVVEALMHPYVLVPEGRFDAEWLRRLADLADSLPTTTPPFSTVYGIAPTEDAAITFTVETLGRLRAGIIALVDGDTAGNDYITALSGSAQRPHAVIQWPENWTIENVIEWILIPGGNNVLHKIRENLGPDWTIETLANLTQLLKTSNNSRTQTFGLKENIISHEKVLNAICESKACAARASDLIDCLVKIAIGQTHAMAVRRNDITAMTAFRFTPA